MHKNMGAPFDHLAPTYDSAFTHTVIGQLQRKCVWRYLEKIMPGLGGLEILELNCGTGTDAVLFGDRGFNIVATDVSEEMLRVTEQKIQQYSLQHKVTSQYLDLDAFDETVFNKRFDLVFSNFGGLNCVAPHAFEKLMARIPSVLSPGGRFVAVIMARHCLWETLYFLLKLRVRNAFRRWTRHEVTADLGGARVKTWYYPPGRLKKWAKPAFSLVNTVPVGFFIPPSYLENFFKRRSRMLLFLSRLEKKVRRFRILSGFSDHYIIDLKLKSGAERGNRKRIS